MAELLPPGPSFLAPMPSVPVGPGPSPTFSVVIAAYQAAEVVCDAVASALAQTEPAHEVIVSDDGSTDDLERALEPYRESIVVLRSNVNGGEAAAKNRGARAATGDFVAILDADDIYLPNRLERLGRLARARPDLDILTTDALLTVGARVVRRCYQGHWTFEVGDQRRGILERNFVFGLVAVRRERMLAAGGFDESIRYTTDWDLWARLILDGARAGCVDEPLAHYRVGPASLSAQRARMAEGRLMTLRKAARHPSLSVDEATVVAASIAAQQRLLALSRARAAVVDGELARRRSFAVAFGRGFSLRTRAKAIAAVLAPGAARRRLRARPGGGPVGAGGTRLDDPAEAGGLGNAGGAAR
jgi:GT2 family glycosyltransferase